MKWTKLGQIFDPTQVNDGIDRDWMKSHSQSPSAVIFDTFVRIYFSCRPEPDSDGQYVSYTTYIDLDRNDLTKVVNIAQSPIMELGELGTFDEFAIYPTSVVQDGTDMLMYYAGWSRCKSVPYTVSIGLAIGNTQGTQFTRYSKGPILTNSAFEPFELSGPKVRKIGGKWYMYYLAGEKWQIVDNRAESLYKIRLAVSDDGVTWTKLNRDLITSKLEDGECQAGPDVFFKDGMYHMYFTYRHAHDYRNKDRGYRIGYAYSSDAITWTRDDSKAGIGLSTIGWDSEMQHYPHVFEVDNDHYMVYNGNDFGRYGLGLAKLNKL
jgi:predicted GH43/DUF377 family glycosyl hydrolase